MKLELTHRGAYAIRAVLTLAREEDGAVVPARTIARRMDIPVRFLPQVLGDLGRAGIVEARLGRAGGYRLAKDPRELSVLAVIEAAEGDARRQVCVLSGRRCGDGEPCDVHAVFAGAQVAILDRLASASVADVLASAGAMLDAAALDAAALDAAALDAAALTPLRSEDSRRARRSSPACAWPRRLRPVRGAAGSAWTGWS